MTNHSSSGILCLFILSVLIILCSAGSLLTCGDSGGTDENIEVFGDSGGGAFEWNETHGFLLTEKGEKVDEAFDITISENVKWSAGENKYKPTGHIFGELEDIHWDDDPEPHIRISEEDFKEYKEDENNLTVYILGEYEHPSEGERQAYRDLLVQRPNNPPIAIPWIAVDDEWEWSNLSEKDSVTYYTDEGVYLKLWFNASCSWDPDGDAIEEWKWDLDEDGKYGETSSEKKENTSAYLGEGEHTLGLLVSDEWGKLSEIREFTVIVKACGENGGTDDDIEMYGEFGGSGHHDWLDIHGLVMIEDGVKVDEEFNVTICETLDLINDSWEPAGHIFGELEGIHWDDDPEPHIQLSDEDFEEYKDDDGTLRVFVYGEYFREHRKGDERRYGYRRRSTERPNVAPIAIGWVAEVGNWSWTNLSEDDEVTYYIGERDNITLCFNGSESWDEDGDRIVKWIWDLDEDGNYGKAEGESGVNCTYRYDPGKYDLGMMVGDGNTYSSTLDFTIRIVAKGEKGGSDQYICMAATAGNGSGGSGDEYAWNEIHGFAISEDEENITESFNVTICIDILWNGQRWEPADHVFGELTGVLCNEDPAPVFTISRDEFYAHSQDLYNLTFYILGEYVTGDRGDDELRQAYRIITLTIENDPPVAVAWLTSSDMDDEGKWDEWKNTSSEDEHEYFIASAGTSVKLYLNASRSWDPDGDTFDYYWWDLDGDLQFGQESRERKMNTSVFLGEGDHSLGLIVGDVISTSSILEFRIVVRQYPDFGASDDTVEIQGEQGDNAIFEWNDIRGLVMYDDGMKYEDEFNVTICSNISKNKGEWEPDGFVFGELRNIRWDDEPEPVITISKIDFNIHATGDHLPVYLFGDFHQPGSGRRYAFVSLVVIFINHKPEPVAWISEHGNWSWVNVTGSGKAIFNVEMGESITLVFNGLDSRDKDNDDIVSWEWDLDEDERYGYLLLEREGNTSRTYHVGTYHLGLKVGDGEDVSDILAFTLMIIQPPLKSDLELQDVSIVNQESGKTKFDKGDLIIIKPFIVNIGNNDTIESFSIIVEYSLDEGNNYHLIEKATVWEYLAPDEFTEIIVIWDTGSVELTLGQYLIRVRVDPGNSIHEEDETNNDDIRELTVQDTIPPEINEPFSVNEILDAEGIESISISGEATDNLGIVRVEYRIEGIEQATQWNVALGDSSWVILIKTGDMKGGEYVVEIRAFDGKQYSVISRTTIEIEESEDGDSDFIPLADGMMILALFAASGLISYRKRS